MFLIYCWTCFCEQGIFSKLYELLKEDNNNKPNNSINSFICYLYICFPILKHVMLPQRIFFINVFLNIHVHVQVDAHFVKRQKTNFIENITWSELGKQNMQAEKVYLIIKWNICCVMLQQQYENYINKMYPRWREELENYRQKQQQDRNGLTSVSYLVKINIG